MSILSGLSGRFAIRTANAGLRTDRVLVARDRQSHDIQDGQFYDKIGHTEIVGLRFSNGRRGYGA